MVVILTSDVGASEKVDGVRRVRKLNNTNKFVENLQAYIKGGSNFVFVASNPTAHEGTDSYAHLTFDSFNMSGFKFDNLFVLDSRTSNMAEDLIKNADLVFLAGGNTLNQMEFFNSINLSKLLKKFKPITIGQSAGALNLAGDVYCSPEDEDELDANKYFKGLGLTNINIEPHFKNSPHFGDDNVIQKILLADSKVKPFIAITDGSYIIDDNGDQTLYGEAYEFKNGSYTQICANGSSLKLSRRMKK